ncbi:MAG TPA: hypothetical protein VGG28_07130 [Kofleriaceae bacterium]|jgi:tetratricopeptide (TPR) repeat protein
MRIAVRVGALNGLVSVAGLIAVMGAWRYTHTRQPVDTAYARGDALWHASCPVEEVGGACLRLAPEPTAPPCGPGSARPWLVVPRDPRKQAAALATLGPLYRGDALREAALAIPVPQDTVHLAAWLKMRAVARERAAATYAELFVGGDPTMTSAALARDAQLADDLANQLLAIEIPSSLDSVESDAYCDAMIAVAEPALDTATQLYAACFAKATELGHVSEWSTLCEDALERLDPAHYPTANELQGTRARAPWLEAGARALQLRDYAAAKHLFELAPTSYDALIGLGIAQRGLGELDRAQASYERARDFDPSRDEAYYNLAILDADFRAPQTVGPDPRTALRRSRDTYQHARELFAKFLLETDHALERQKAQGLMSGCDDAIAQLDAVLDQ